jgi:hypothetical protein
MRIIASTFFLALLTFGCIPTFAHHGNAAYDETKPITLTGTVTEFDFVNPHTQLYFDVKSAEGKVTHWACETLSPGKLSRAGWSRDAVKSEDQVTITLFPVKSGEPVGLLRDLTFNRTGKQLGLQEQ